MAEKYITKTKKVKGEEVKINYRIDPDFVPQSQNDICQEFIENYCAANDKIDWLLEEVNTTTYSVTRKDEKGEMKTTIVHCDNYPFVNLRRDFIKEFFPAMIKGKATTETWKEKLNKKYGRKG